MGGPPETGSSGKKRIFVSYSREPSENAQFVRALSHQLTLAGFEVWLDEEQIAAGGDIAVEIKEAIKRSDAGLFVVNSRWLNRDRNWIRHEVALFARQAGIRRVLVLREDMDDPELDPYFSTLKRLTWLPQDPSPDARFWEVYCGLTAQPPGRAQEWEARGRALLARPSGVQHDGKQKESEARAIELPCRGRPIACFPAGDFTFLLTDRDEWVGVGEDGALHPPIPHLGSCATAAITAANSLLVAGYEASVARLMDGRWEILEQESAVLCFASVCDADIVGTASGGIVVLDRYEMRPALRTRDPVISIASYEGGLLVLGSRGLFGRVSWPPGAQSDLSWLQTNGLGRPFGFFQAVESNHIGVASATRAGVLEPETGRLLVCPRNFEEGIREIVFLGAQGWPYAILTDTGSVVMMDASLTSTRQVRFPGRATITGCAGAGLSGSAFAWTDEGRLYRVSAHGGAEGIADADVVLAYGVKDGSGGIVRWHAERGATVELLGTA